MLWNTHWVHWRPQTRPGSVFQLPKNIPITLLQLYTAGVKIDLELSLGMLAYCSSSPMWKKTLSGFSNCWWQWKLLWPPLSFIFSFVNVGIGRFPPALPLTWRPCLCDSLPQRLSAQFLHSTTHTNKTSELLDVVVKEFTFLFELCHKMEVPGHAAITWVLLRAEGVWLCVCEGGSSGRQGREDVWHLEHEERAIVNFSHNSIDWRGGRIS